MKKKVVLLSGSPRPRGNTIQVLEVCAKVIENFDLETEIISLSGKKIFSCNACYKCEEIKDKCAIEDDLNGIMGQIREARGLIIGTPVYFGTSRGDLINLIQRMGMVNICGDYFLSGKVGGPIAIARHSGYVLPLEEIIGFYRICGMIIPNSLYFTNIVGRNPGEALKDTKGIKAVQHFAEDVAKIIIKS